MWVKPSFTNREIAGNHDNISTKIFPHFYGIVLQFSFGRNGVSGSVEMCHERNICMRHYYNRVQGVIKLT